LLLNYSEKNALKISLGPEKVKQADILNMLKRFFVFCFVLNAQASNLNLSQAILEDSSPKCHHIFELNTFSTPFAENQFQASILANIQSGVLKKSLELMGAIASSLNIPESTYQELIDSLLNTCDLEGTVFNKQFLRSKAMMFFETSQLKEVFDLNDLASVQSLFQKSCSGESLQDSKVFIAAIKNYYLFKELNHNMFEGQNMIECSSRDCSITNNFTYTPVNKSSLKDALESFWCEKSNGELNEFKSSESKLLLGLITMQKIREQQNLLQVIAEEFIEKEIVWSKKILPEMGKSLSDFEQIHFKSKTEQVNYQTKTLEFKMDLVFGELDKIFFHADKLIVTKIFKIEAQTLLELQKQLASANELYVKDKQEQLIELKKSFSQNARLRSFIDSVATFKKVPLVYEKFAETFLQELQAFVGKINQDGLIEFPIEIGVGQEALRELSSLTSL
jgi:hypothetical protein